MLVHDKEIAIIGGGMGGLTLARLLQLKHARVKVYERDFNREVRVQGSTLDLHEGTGLEAMKRAGLLGEFYKYHRPVASKMRLADKDMKVYFDDHDLPASIAENRPEIDRAPLRDILLNSLQPDTVVWNSRFVSMEKQQEGWTLHFENGTTAYADLVIGADGASSKVRPYISIEKPVYAGVTLIEGYVYDAQKNVPFLYEFSRGGKVMAFANGQTMLYGSKGDGSIMFVASFKAPENWLTQTGIDFTSKALVIDWFRDAYKEWSREWDAFFINDAVHFTPRPQYYFPLDQHWPALPNLTMLGDAAHRMPPFAGEGANVAMQDAFELADRLTSQAFPDLQTAIAHFEKDMQQRGAAATKDTLENTGRMHSERALEEMLAFFTGS